MLSWTCHICEDERPDARISVHKRKVAGAGVEYQENIRYCNDRPECALAALDFTHTRS